MTTRGLQNVRWGLFWSQLLFVICSAFLLGLLYGGLSISDGTTWIFPLNFLSLGNYWEPLGWWDSVLGQAALFFQIVASPFLVFLSGRIFRLKGNVALSCFGSVAGGLCGLFFLFFALTTPPVQVPWFFFFLHLILSPMTGAVLGYWAGGR